jgi:hypothetical protein
MLFIGAYWWVWGLGMVISAALLGKGIYNFVFNSPSSPGHGVGYVLLRFIPIWGFGFLFGLSIMVNLILLVKS